ncbi:MAG: MarR family transcriptional regulator [Bdellovibrionales bacterium]|nr:MarR family transcriptional regulator [Bdellovibrionales bacterium]
MKILQFLSQSPDFQLDSKSKQLKNQLQLRLNEHDLTRTQALFLVALYFEEGHQVSFDQLSQTFEISKGGLSQNLSLLENKKLIRRSAQKGDRRANDVTLRDEAKDLCIKLIGIFDQHQREVESRVEDSELKDFFSTLEKL